MSKIVQDLDFVRLHVPADGRMVHTHVIRYVNFNMYVYVTISVHIFAKYFRSVDK